MLDCNRVPSFTPDNRAESIATAERNMSPWMREALAGLTQPQLEAMLMVYQLGMMETEAAEVLGVSQSAIAQSIARALKKAKVNIVFMREEIIKGVFTYLRVQ